MQNDTEHGSDQLVSPENSEENFLTNGMDREERLSLLLNALPDLVCFKDGEGRWLETNEANIQFFQLRDGDHLGKTNREIADEHPNCRQALLECAESDEQAWQHGKFFRMRDLLTMPDGSCRELDYIRIPLFYDNGSRKGLLSLGRDITEQENDRRRIGAARAQQSVINNIQRIALSTEFLEEQLQEVLEVIYSLPWLPLKPKGAVFLKSEEKSEELRMVAQKNLDSRLLKLCSRVPYGWCLCGRAARDQEFVYSSCIDGDHDISYEEMEEHGHYIIPLTKDGDLLGVVCLYLQQGHAWSVEEQSFLTDLVDSLVVMIQHNQAEEALRRSESNLVKARRLARIGHWEWDLKKDDRLDYSPEVGHILGLSADTLPSSRAAFKDMVHPDDLPVLEAKIAKALRGKRPYSVEYRLIRPDGRERILMEEGEVVSNEKGEALRLVGILQDVTIIKKSEESLFLAAKVFESSLEGITITDSDGGIQMVNSAFTDITGYTAEEVIGRNPRILKSDRHDPAFYEEMWLTLKRTGQWQGEIWNRRKNGEIYPEWLTITAVKNGQGQTTNYVAVFHDMSELKEKEEEVKQHRYNDPLTGLPNRTLFQDRLAVAIAKSEDKDRKLAVMLLDIDNFKHVNDSYGHSFGDLLLQLVAKSLVTGIRGEDTVARYGGDEFIFLLNNVTREDTSVDTAMRIMKLMSKPFHLKGEEIHLTCSIGITLFPADGNNSEVLIKNADIALNRAKIMGKSSYQLFTSAMNELAQKRMALENDLRKALRKKEFQIFYQPKVDLKTGEITGMEALLRWSKADGSLVSPVDFIPVAEETGLIVDIGDWVLKQACSQAQEWRRRGHDIKVSVNLSPRQFSRKDLVEQVTAALEKTGLPPENLELEITESTVMADEKAAIEMLWKLSKKGIQLSIDDFGTGYSSLQYMRQLPIDTIKIDRSFIKDIPQEEGDMAITAGAISMSHALHLKVVAEGVETMEQVRFLREKGCEEMQGFLCSPPVPVVDFEELLKRRGCLKE